MPGAMGDISRARAAHSRNRAENSDVEPTRSRTMRSSSSESNANSSMPGRRVSVMGMRRTMPSSAAMACAS